MVDTTKKYKVVNVCRFDIGVVFLNGVGVNIKPGSFQMMSVDDILFCESICTDTKLFAQGYLEIRDERNQPVSIEEFDMVPASENEIHKQDSEIEALLKGNIKKMEAWLKTVDDKAELFAISEVAKKLDLPAGKLKLLKEKMPDTELL